jgi:hypothetical protein
VGDNRISDRIYRKPNFNILYSMKIRSLGERKWARKMDGYATQEIYGDDTPLDNIQDEGVERKRPLYLPVMRR